MDIHENLSVIEGVLESVVYHNDENGYTVFTLGHEAEYTTCTGHLANPIEGESLRVMGNFIVNPRYGRQLSITRVERTTPNTKTGIEKYLASGAVKGIGAKTAKLIVAKFGEDTFHIIENEPQKLSELRGISLKRAFQMSESFHAVAGQRRAMLFLQEYGVTPAASMKIYKRYKEDTVEIIKSNPYRLADDIDGIGFRSADAIAYKLGVDRDSPERISAGLRYCLWEATTEGHTYVPTSFIVRKTSELLMATPAAIEHELIRMHMDRSIIRENTESEPIVFLSSMYYAETDIARKLIELAHAYGRQLSWTEQKDSEQPADTAQPQTSYNHDEYDETPTSGISLSDGQKRAVDAAMQEGILVITGGPGTGKTTTINTIIGMLEAKGLDITLTAPTGRAAKRMTETTGRDATTIHRLLEVKFISEDTRRQTFEKNEENPIETDVLIVDETSMIDVLLMHSLLKAVAPGTRIILVGDVDQLPSIGAGNVLKDIIDSNCVPVVILTEIFRQAAESAIITNAHLINKGKYPEINERDKDFFFVKRSSPDQVAATILELISERLPAYKNFDPISDIQILTPMRKSTIGVAHLNQLLQAKLNPPAPEKHEREYGHVVYREGDKVMQIKNNYDATWEIYNAQGFSVDFGEGVFNGDIGIIHEINDDGLIIVFDDEKHIAYDFTQLDEIELAYAATVHKAQGSEYKVVIIPVHSGPPMLLTRNLLYTALTRAKELAVLVGLTDTLHRMVDNNRISMRYTALTRRLQQLVNIDPIAGV